MTAISHQMSSSAVAQLRVSLDRIRVAENVRELDLAHVDALAASIELQVGEHAGDVDSEAGRDAGDGESPALAA